MSVIYLVPKSPLGSSTLPSTAALRQSDEPPSICGIHELTAPSRHSMTITRHLVVSYTTFSPLPCFHLKTQQGGYFLLPTPTVTNSFYFRKWDALCCPDFPLSSPSGNASDKPEHCFRTAKVTKKFDLTANFAKFLNSFRFSLPSQCRFQDIREGFLTTFLLTFFIFVYNLQTFSFIYRSRKFQKSSKQL